MVTSLSSFTCLQLKSDNSATRSPLSSEHGTTFPFCLQVAEAPKVRLNKVQDIAELDEDVQFRLPTTEDRDIDLSLLTAVLCSSEQVRGKTATLSSFVPCRHGQGAGCMAHQKASCGRQDAQFKSMMPQVFFKDGSISLPYCVSILFQTALKSSTRCCSNRGLSVH